MKVTKSIQRVLTILLMVLLFAGNAVSINRINAESEATTIKLIQDMTLNENIVINENQMVVLDLNDHILDLNGYQIINNGILTITDTGSFTERGWERETKWATAEARADGVCTYGGVITNGCEESIRNNGTLTLESGTVFGCSNPAIYIDSSSNFTMTGGSICYCNDYSVRTQEGGTVFDLGNFRMTGGEIFNNESHCEFSGGGVTVEGVFTMDDGTIRNNKSAYNGGGVYVSTSGTFTMQSGYISDNTASDGNGTSYGGGVCTDGGMWLFGGYINGNTSDFGCGVAVNAVSSGGIAGSLTMSGGSISYNGKYDANNYSGGGVYVDKDAFLTLTGGFIKENYASKGSGVFNEGTFVMDGGYVMLNACSYGTAGGVYNTGTFEMKNGSVQDNSIFGHAGGVYNDGKFTMSGGAVTNNSSESGDGGGVYNCEGRTFEMKGGTITGNASGNINYYQFNNGAGVFNAGTMTMSAGSIEYNTSSMEGGGVFNDGKFVLIDGTIKNNTSYGNGAGVYNYLGDTFEMKGGTISYNSASDSYDMTEAGGVYNQGTMTMTGGKIEYNTATRLGGGVVNMGTFILDGGSINNNNAIYSANGVYNGYLSTFNMKSGTVSYNVSDSFRDVEGGGVYNDGTMNFSGGTISNNGSYYGAGIYNAGTAEMTGGVIKENYAEKGSGVYANGGEFIFEDGEIKENTAESIGGGVYVCSAASFAMKGGKITGNMTNGDNSAMYVDGIAYLAGGSITGNRKLSDNVGFGLDFGSVYVSLGGGIYLSGNIVIKDNLNYHDKQCNLYLDNSYDGFDIYDEDELTDGAEIHFLVCDKSKPFIRDLEDTSALKYFVSDDSGYGVKAIENDEYYDVYLKMKYLIFYVATYGESFVDSNTYMEGEEVELPATSAPVSSGFKASGWQLYNDAYYTSDGMTKYTVNSADADGDTIYLFQSIVPIITDINGKEGGENSVTRMTVNEADDINYHITAISYNNLYDRNDLSNSVKVWVDENDNGSFDSGEELTYGEDFDVSAGSVNVTLKKEYLNTLELGNHKAKVQVTVDRPEDYDFETSIKVSRKVEESTYRVVNTCTE